MEWKWCFVFSSDCSIQSDHIAIKNEEKNSQSLIHFNDLIVDVKKGTEIASPEMNNSAIENGSITRTFK